MLAIFDDPARAVHGTSAIVAAVRDLRVEVRAGVPAGESERSGTSVRGIAVHLGARIAAAAAEGWIPGTSSDR